jgi:hypothetical protein
VIDFNTLLSSESQQRNFRVKLHHKASELNRYVQNIPPNSNKVHILFSKHGTFSKIDHILGHKASLETIFHMLSDYNGDYNGIKLEINNKENYRNYENTWRLNNSVLNNQWVIEKTR